MDRCPVVERSVQEKLRKTCPVIVLASQSPNRRKVLENAGVQVIIRPQNIWEICGETEPSKVVTALSSQKMGSYLKSQEFDSSLPAVAIDTLVCLDGKLIGKPKDDEDARSMLRSFSGKWHEVYSGMSVYVPESQKTICIRKDFRTTFSGPFPERTFQRSSVCSSYVPRSISDSVHHS